MVIFNSYVKLPEGTPYIPSSHSGSTDSMCAGYVQFLSSCSQCHLVPHLCPWNWNLLSHVQLVYVSMLWVSLKVAAEKHCGKLVEQPLGPEKWFTSPGFEVCSTVNTQQYLHETKVPVFCLSSWCIRFSWKNPANLGHLAFGTWLILINMINPMFSLLQIHSLNHQISRRWPYFPALRELQEVLFCRWTDPICRDWIHQRNPLENNQDTSSAIQIFPNVLLFCAINLVPHS